MIWQNPWAWAGLVSLVLPVLIHLLGRGQAPRRPFPSLRFLPASRSLPTRRRRIRDPLLLLVRLAVLAAAVIALVQPLVRTVARSRDAERGLARVILVDTSASMRRRTVRGGESGLVAARREATRLAAEAQSSLVIESANPARALAGAVAWVGRQTTRTELVIVSDFQTGAIDARSLATVPPAIGIRLSRIEVTPSTDASVTRAADIESAARVTTSATGADVEWMSSAANAGGAHANVVVLTGANEQIEADAARRAATTLGVRLPFDSSRAIAIVYPSFAGRDTLMKRATELRSPWMVEVVARLRGDSTLIAAADADGTAPAARVDSGGFLTVARNRAGEPLVVATEGTVDGANRLVLLPLVNAGSLTSAGLIAAAARATSAAPPVAEVDPSTIDDALLHSWQREPGAAQVAGDARTGASDGRWLWVLALLLLALETVIRRERREQTLNQVAHDRAA